MANLTNWGSYALTLRRSSKGYHWKANLKVAAESAQSRQDPDSQPPWLVPLGVEWEDSLPLGNPALHRGFAALRTRDIKSFADIHGLLGIETQLTDPKGNAVVGESLARWRKEIEDMSVLLTIWDMADGRHEPELADIIIWTDREHVRLRAEWQYDHSQGICLLLPSLGGDAPASDRRIVRRLIDNPFAVGDEEKGLVGFWRQKGGLAAPAKCCVADGVNYHLRKQLDLQVRLDVKRERYETCLVPRNLLATMWLMFSWEITGRTRPMMCAECGKWVDEIDPRQKFCSNRCRQRYYRSGKPRLRASRLEEPVDEGRAKRLRSRIGSRPPKPEKCCHCHGSSLMWDETKNLWLCLQCQRQQR